MDFINQLIDATEDMIVLMDEREEKTPDLNMAREAAEVLLEELRALQ